VVEPVELAVLERARPAAPVVLALHRLSPERASPAQAVAVAVLVEQAAPQAVAAAVPDQPQPAAQEVPTQVAAAVVAATDLSQAAQADQA
jgi:hypothetical protein